MNSLKQKPENLLSDFIYIIDQLLLQAVSFKILVYSLFGSIKKLVPSHHLNLELWPVFF
jgi:hypothetical protein